jgi:septal ring factor EnvC (AmiA/AmiB activator)
MDADRIATSEWTSAVELAVQAEIQRRRRRLQWAIALALGLAVLAIALAISLRGVSWAELETRLEPLAAADRLASFRQATQQRQQQDLNAELLRLEAELQRVDAAVRAAALPDPGVLALQRRVRQLERDTRAALADRQRLEARIDALRPAAPPGDEPGPAQPPGR